MRTVLCMFFLDLHLKNENNCLQANKDGGSVSVISSGDWKINSIRNPDFFKNFHFLFLTLFLLLRFPPYFHRQFDFPP